MSTPDTSSHPRCTMKPGPNPILKYFACAHLRRGPLRQTSAWFCDLAVLIDDALPAGPEKSVALRKLLESKDAAVRAALDLVEADR